MGLTRSFLNELGLEKGTIDAIMSEHGTSVNELKAQIQTLTGEKEDLTKKIGETAELKTQYDELNKSYKKLESEKAKADAERQEIDTKHTNDINALKRDFAINKAIMKSNPIDEKAYRVHLDDSKLTINDKGELEGFEEQDKEIRGKYGYLFSDVATGGAHGGIDSQHGATMSLEDAINETL